MRDDRDPQNKHAKRLLVALLVLLAGSPAGLALADSDAAVSIVYTAPSACPGAESFSNQLRARSVRIRVVRDEKVRALHVRIDPRDGRFLGHLVLRDVGGTETERTVVGDTCPEVVTSLAFVAAVAIDPTSSTTATTPAQTASNATGGSSLDAGLGAPASSTTAAPSALPSASKPRDEGARKPPDVEEDARDEPTLAVRRRQRSWGVAVGLDGQLLSGTSPSVLFTLPVFVDVSSTTRTIFSPGARLRFERASSSTDTNGSGAQFTWTAGTLDLCPIAWSPGPLRATPCLRTEAGLLEAAGIGVQPARRSSRFWMSMGVAGRVMLTVVDPVFLELDGSLSAPFVRDRFLVQPNTTLFRVPALEWGVGLGIGARIW